MTIDWLTVVAQIVNFLVLVALLKRFLYRPVLDAMARREARIAGRLHMAEQREADAARRAEVLQQKTDDLERNRQELLDQARAAADVEGRQELARAREHVDRQRQEWQTQLQREWEETRKAIGRRLTDTVTNATRRALADLADADLEAAIANVFRRRLAGIADTDGRALAEAPGGLEIATGFDLAEGVKRDLIGTVRDRLGCDARVVRADELGAGVELRAAGWKVSWTIAEYLRDLDAHIAEAVAAGARTGTEG